MQFWLKIISVSFPLSVSGCKEHPRFGFWEISNQLEPLEKASLRIMMQECWVKDNVFSDAQ